MFKFVFVLLAALFAVSMASPSPLPVSGPAPRPVARPEPAPQFYTPYAYSGGYYASPYAYYG
ncbi:neuropeptide-like precursor 4 [Cochliomyia hominivorax]